jgi:sphingomyelin phosphodiesterase
MSLPANLTANWLYELAAYYWEGWIPGQSDNILRGGYYSYEVNPNFKVISLNTMFCYNYNLYG